MLPTSNQSPEFIWPVRVYYEDTDAAGVVYYANYLRFMERARTEWLRHLGFEQDHLRQKLRVLFIVREVQVRYHKPACFNDSLQVTAKISQQGRASFSFLHEIRRVEGNPSETVLLSVGTTSLACVDAESLRPKAIPEIIIHALGGQK